MGFFRRKNKNKGAAGRPAASPKPPSASAGTDPAHLTATWAAALGAPSTPPSNDSGPCDTGSSGGGSGSYGGSGSDGSSSSGSSYSGGDGGGSSCGGGF